MTEAKMQITEQMIEQLEKLAKLSLTADERLSMQNDLQAILSYARKLEHLQTDGIEPAAYVQPISNVFRADVCTESTKREELLANAPAQNCAGAVYC